MKYLVHASALAIGASLATAASSATLEAPGGTTQLSWFSYSESEIQDALDQRALLDTNSEVALETFEGFTPVPDGGGIGTEDKTPLVNTGVGDFTTTDAAGNCGGSCDQPDDQSLIRDTSSFGRYNLTDQGSNWLDSNDNPEITLTSSGFDPFNSLSFFLTDVDDVGDVTFNITINGDFYNIASEIFDGNKQSDADLFLVEILFDEDITGLDLVLNIDDGDGFGIDDVRYGLSTRGDGGPPPDPIPLPAGVVLLLSGLGALGAAKARRKKS